MRFKRPRSTRSLAVTHTEDVTRTRLDADFLKIVQSRAARVAISPSTVRGQGHAGVCKAARRFLCQLDLTLFAVANAEHFERALDLSTMRLQRALPSTARKWGLARKILNVFLRDCLYTTYLEKAHRLRRSERFYELPLDSITVGELKRRTGRGGLPVWRGVIHLTRDLSHVLQEAASAEARKQGLARVHLDALWWSFDRDPALKPSASCSIPLAAS